MKNLLLFLFISISSISYSQVGIDTDSPTKTLDVNGEVRIRTTNTSTSTKDINLVIDSDGVVKRDSKESDGLFRGYLSRDFSATNDGITKITNFKVLQNPGDNFDSSTNIFTVKTTGLYKITFSATIITTDTTMPNIVVGLANASTNKWISRFSIMKENLTTNTLGNMYTFSGIVKLNKNDKCYFGAAKTTKLLYYPTGSTGSGLGTFFEIQLVSTEG